MPILDLNARVFTETQPTYTRPIPANGVRFQIPQAVVESPEESQVQTAWGAEPPFPTNPQDYLRPVARPTRALRDTESSRRVVFMDNISDAIREDRDLGFTKQSYITRLTQGELLRAAQAYEHVRPELWPFGNTRRFNATEISAWRRLARAAAFLELECKRLNAPGTEEHKDAVHEIRRLTSKAIDCRWSSLPEQDPF